MTNDYWDDDAPPPVPTVQRTGYSDAEILAMREATVAEVRKFSENAICDLKRELKSLRKQLELAESLIPLTRKHTYEWLNAQPSYGGSDPD